MSWLGRERRRGPRSPGAERERRDLPTYLVERDAPSGPPRPYVDRFGIRNAVERVKNWRVDAYPDHTVPFEDEPPPDAGPAEPLDPVIAERLPEPDRNGPPVRVVVYRGRKGRAVNIAPFRWDRPDLWPRTFIATIVYAIRDTIEQLRRDDEGQGLAEYALVLAFVAIVAIVALLFIGSQVSAVLSEIGASV